MIFFLTFAFFFVFERCRACDLPGLARAWIGLRSSFLIICIFLFLNDVQYLIYMVARVLGLVCLVHIAHRVSLLFAWMYLVSHVLVLVWRGQATPVDPYSSRGRSREASLLLSSNMVRSWPFTRYPSIPSSRYIPSPPPYLGPLYFQWVLFLQK